MTSILEKANASVKTAATVHPLEPLTAEEITIAVTTVKQEKSLGDRVRFMSVALQEPPKDCVLAYRPGDEIDRQAFIVLMDNATAKTYEAIVSISDRVVVSWEHIADAQPGFVLDEFFECEAAVKASPEFQAALLKRGITDLDLVMVDPWSAGNYDPSAEQGLRLSRALSWVRSSPTDNGYARPIEGVIAVIDLNKMEVLRVEDYGVVPLPPQAGNYAPEFVNNYRQDLKPLEIVQPEGASFQVNGHEICWYFYQDGTIQYEIKLTGIMNTGSVMPGEKPEYGTLVAPQLYAPNYQHFFSVRLDMTVDGQNNSVYEVNTQAAPMGPANPYGNAFYSTATLLANELAAQRIVDPFAGRYWKIVNPDRTNQMGEPVGYKLMPGENILPFAHPEASVTKRAAYMTKHLWVTPYSPKESYPTGDYPNQHPGGAGLPEWTKADRPIANTDIVVWYTLGNLHIPRAEDWPVMPASYLGFMLKPVNFFNENPANDVPASTGKHKCH
jgi:Cu2+-containing amine oxidase